MQPIRGRFIWVELYFDDLEKAKNSTRKRSVLQFLMSRPGTMRSSIAGGRFICLERKGAGSYPSKDKAVLFFEVPSLKSAMAAIGHEKIVHSEPTWAVLHDPEGHNVLLLQKAAAKPK
jgi:hypothetical protein